MQLAGIMGQYRAGTCKIRTENDSGRWERYEIVFCSLMLA